jgi:hypothetical protein
VVSQKGGQRYLDDTGTRLPLEGETIKAADAHAAAEQSVQAAIGCAIRPDLVLARAREPERNAKRLKAEAPGRRRTHRTGILKPLTHTIRRPHGEGRLIEPSAGDYHVLNRDIEVVTCL